MQSREDVKIDDFKNVFNSVEVKIIWFLTWIISESFNNAYLYFVIMFEKYGGQMTVLGDIVTNSLLKSAAMLFFKFSANKYGF